MKQKIKATTIFKSPVKRVVKVEAIRTDEERLTESRKTLAQVIFTQHPTDEDRFDASIIMDGGRHIPTITKWSTSAHVGLAKDWVKSLQEIK